MVAMWVASGILLLLFSALVVAGFYGGHEPRSDH
jgi:hypothetical protein